MPGEGAKEEETQKSEPQPCPHQVGSLVGHKGKRLSKRDKTNSHLKSKSAKICHKKNRRQLKIRVR